MDLREEFVRAHLRGEDSVAALCRYYEISRKTGYKWIRRFEEEGLEGLEDRSRAPLLSPQAISEELQDVIVRLRKKHPKWGPKKLKALLEKERPRETIPAASTIGDLLRARGLSTPRKRRTPIPRYSSKLVEYGRPNDVWCADFKGDVPLRGGGKVCPLTITDGASRFLLRCEATRHLNMICVREVFESAFSEFGLPKHIRTDNGAPFVTRSLGGLSRLSIWWMKLGVAHERIAPGKPQQNGRHERMHLTLKTEACGLPRVTCPSQQRRFDIFRARFNEVRPHEALDMQTPADVYRKSRRRYPRRLIEPSYEQGLPTRRIKHHGGMKWAGREIFVSNALAGERVGLRPMPDGNWKVVYGVFELGIMSPEGTFLTEKRLRRPRR